MSLALALTQRQADVLDSLVKLGHTTPRVLAEDTGTPLDGVRYSLRVLSDRGLAQGEQIGNRWWWKPTPDGLRALGQPHLQLVEPTEAEQIRERLLAAEIPGRTATEKLLWLAGRAGVAL